MSALQSVHYRITKLRKRADDLRLRDFDDVSAYAEEFDRVYDELGRLSSRCVPDEIVKIHQFVYGLGPKFEDFRSVLF